MPRSKTVIRWQRKENRAPLSNVKLNLQTPDGLSPVASWLDSSQPSEILNDLRDYQSEWCPHVYRVIAQVKQGDKMKTVYSCVECNHVDTKHKVTSG